MTTASQHHQISARKLLSQLFALGFLARIVQALAIIALFNLNDYFTTPAQLPALLPISALIILLLVLVAVADSVSTRIGHRLVNRLAAIQHIYGTDQSNRALAFSSPVQQRNYLRTVFLPLFTAVSPAPLLIYILISNTPGVFTISMLQGLVNTLIIMHFNRQSRGERPGTPPAPDLLKTTSQEVPAHLLRRADAPRATSRDSHKEYDSSLRRKKEILRNSNLLFRGLIIIASAILAIYRFSSLTSLIGFFILNNTLQSSVIVVAEYCLPVLRHLTFREALAQIELSLQSEPQLLQALQERLAAHAQAEKQFDERMGPRLIQKPYLRFKDFRVLCDYPSQRRIIDNISARFELLPITLVHVVGSRLSNDLSSLIVERMINSSRCERQGLAVCAQLKIDIAFWRQIPIANPKQNRIVATTIKDHFPPEYQSRLKHLNDLHDIDKYYLEGEPRPAFIQDLTQRQLRRMQALISLFDALLNPHCLWLLAFVLDHFNDVESKELFDIFRQQVSPDQRSIFLLTSPLQVLDGQIGSYELRRSSLKPVS